MDRKSSKRFVGLLYKDDVNYAIKRGISIKPNNRRLYIDLQNDKIQFVIRKRMEGGSVVQVVVHEIPVGDRPIIDMVPFEIDYSDAIHGFANCINTDKYDSYDDVNWPRVPCPCDTISCNIGE